MDRKKREKPEKAKKEINDLLQNNNDIFEFEKVITKQS